MAWAATVQFPPAHAEADPATGILQHISYCKRSLLKEIDCFGSWCWLLGTAVNCYYVSLPLLLARRTTWLAVCGLHVEGRGEQLCHPAALYCSLADGSQLHRLLVLSLTHPGSHTKLLTISVLNMFALTTFGMMVCSFSRSTDPMCKGMICQPVRRMVVAIISSNKNHWLLWLALYAIST